MSENAEATGPSDVAFETDRCRLRNWRDSDVDRVLDLYSRWEVARWLGAQPKAMETLEQAQGLVDRWGEINREEPVAGRWAVERKSDGLLVGTVILVPLPDGDGEFEVGWHFHPDSWGQGLASESAKGALSWGFEHGLDEIFAVVRPDNAPSIAVCRRLGMEELGRTTRYYQTELELFRITP